MTSFYTFKILKLPSPEFFTLKTPKFSNLFSWTHFLDLWSLLLLFFWGSLISPSLPCALLFSIPCWISALFLTPLWLVNISSNSEPPYLQLSYAHHLYSLQAQQACCFMARWFTKVLNRIISTAEFCNPAVPLDGLLQLWANDNFLYTSCPTTFVPVSQPFCSDHVLLACMWEWHLRQHQKLY